MKKRDTAKVFYVEEWTTLYKIWKVKANSEEEVKDFYWDEKDERVEVLYDDIIDNSETNFYKEKDREQICGWQRYMGGK